MMIQKENFVRIIVSDTGIGLAKEDIPKLFQKFQQLSREYNRRKGGSGLGLAIVKKIVEAHKGNITVESEPDKGSSFSIDLPIGL